MSSPAGPDRLQAIGQAIMRWQDATARYDEEFGAREDLSASERQCLAALANGPRPAREIADATRLARASVTTLVDRLEVRGLVRRAADQQDRRQVLVSLTVQAEAMAQRYYGPIARQGAKFLASFSKAEQATILKFLEGALALQLDQLDRIRNVPVRPQDGR